MDISKICRCCSVETPYDQLVKHKGCSCGVDALCKACNRAKSREWYAHNKAKAQASMDAYYQVNRDKLLIYKRNWQITNRSRADEKPFPLASKASQKTADAITSTS